VVITTTAERTYRVLTERFCDGHRAQDGHQRHDYQAGPQSDHAFEKRELFVFVFKVGKREPELRYAASYTACLHGHGDIIHTVTEMTVSPKTVPRVYDNRYIYVYVYKYLSTSTAIRRRL